MKIKQKFLMSVILFAIIFFIGNPIKANAALQANGNSSKADNVENWLLNIRKMEEAGGTLGLSDTIDTTNLLSTATTSNNLDIHMQKNTEYGAMAILSASAYGNQNIIASGETTTGNKSGVVINLNKEWVSAGSLTDSSAYKNANAKYKNFYTINYVAKVGDAISETKGWHSSGASTWITNDTGNADANSGLLRDYSGSLFSYYGDSASIWEDKNAHYKKPWSSRAVIVIGKGF